MWKEKRMDRNKLRSATVFILMGLGIVYVAAMMIFTDATNMNFNNEEIEEIVDFHAESGTIDEDVVCPVVLETPSGEMITYTTVIEKEYPISNVIMVRSSFQYMKAFINNECVLAYGEEQQTFNHVLPSSAWHVIRPKEKLVPGDILRVEVICNIDPYQGLFRGVLVGTKASMLYMIINNARMALIVSIPLFILGILYIVICRIFPEKKSRKKLCILGTLSVMSSVWILLESQLIQLVWGILPVSYTLLFVIFSLLPILICYLMLQYKMFEDSLPTKIAFVYIIFCIFIFHALQIFEIAQYSKSFWIIHTAFIAEILAFIIEVIRRVKGPRNKEDQDIITSGAIFALFGLADIINIHVFHEILKDVVFVQIGVFAFMLLLGFYTLRRAVYNHDSTMEQEFWKQVAHTDALTKLGNRLCFEEQKKELKKSKHNKGITVLMIDINDLKIINDEYGHEMGDVAIATVGQVLIDVFDKFGEGFRIGGDEFCLFLGMLNKEQAIKKAQACEEKLNEFSEEYEIPLHISKGFSEIGEDGVDAAINEADAEMYKNKSYSKILWKKKEAENNSKI